MFTNVLNGVSATVRNYRMVLLIWAWHVALAAVAVAPGLAWWRGAFNHSIEAGTLLSGFSFAVLADVTKYDNVGAFGLLTSAMVGAALLSIVASSFIMGGMLNVISGAGTARGMMHRFFGGGGYFFWRFTRLMLVGGACVVVGGVVLTAALVAIESPLTENGSETGAYLWLLFNLGALGVMCGLFLLALDYARIQVVIEDARGMFRAYVRALAFVVRHAPTAYGMAIVILIAVGILFVGYLWYETASPVASSWGAIAILFVLQQAIALAQIGLRVSLVESEFCFARRLASAAMTATARTSVVTARPNGAGVAPYLPEDLTEPAADRRPEPDGAGDRDTPPV